MDKLKTRKTIIILWFFLFFISTILLYTQATSSVGQKSGNNDKKPAIKVQESSLKNSVDKEFFPELLQVVMKQVDHLTTMITIILLIFSILISLLVGFFEWHAVKENKEFQKKIRDSLKEMEERVATKFQNEIMQRIISQLRDQIKSHEYILMEHLDIEVDPIEKRIMKAEKVRSDIWDLLVVRLIEALEKQNWNEYMKGWVDFHKLQVALSQILSKDATDICTGLGTFINLHQEGLAPSSLWDLILLLKKQNRIQGLTIMPLLEKLGKAMGRSLDEKPETIV